MSLVTLIRPAIGLALVFALAGCYGAPAVQQPYQPGSVTSATGPMLIGSQCAAGFYQCALPVAGPVGTGCSCPGLGGPSYGVIR